MDKREVRVRLKASTTISELGGAPQKMCHVGYGEIRMGDPMRLHYEDHSGDEKVSICLTGSEKEMMMQRDGETHGTLYFLPGKQTEGRYVTPFGEIPMLINTQSISVESGESEGRICLRYQFGMDENDLSQGEFECQWKY